MIPNNLFYTNSNQTTLDSCALVHYIVPLPLTCELPLQTMITELLQILFVVHCIQGCTFNIRDEKEMSLQGMFTFVSCKIEFH